MKKIPGVLLALFLLVAPVFAAEVRPNILWFIVDDMSANFSSYGEKLIETPHVDRLAKARASVAPTPPRRCVRRVARL